MSGGRRTKLTPEVQEKIVNYVKLGNYLSTAAQMAGVDYGVVMEWLARGRGTSSRRRTALYAEFAEAVDKAVAQSEAVVVTHWRGKTDQDWRAAAEFLARRFPERWSPRVTQKIEAQVETTAQAPAVELMTTAQLLERAAALEALAAQLAPEDDGQDAADEAGSGADAGA